MPLLLNNGIFAYVILIINFDLWAETFVFVPDFYLRVWV